MHNVFERRIRTDWSDKTRAESAFRYLDRSAQSSSKASRAFIELLLSHVPLSERKQLVSRLQCDDRGHYSAFHELTLHEALRQQGCNVEWLERPEFKIRQPDSSEFYLEAKMSMNVSVGPPRGPRAERIREYIYKMDLPNYWLSISELNEGSSDLRQSRLRRHIDEEIGLLESRSARGTSLQAFEEDGWFIRLIAFPLAEYPYPTKMETYDGAPCGPTYPLRSHLEKKAGEYGTFDRPYVIAIDTCDDRVNENRHLADTLFGTRSDAGTSNSGFSRGFWGTPTTPENQRVSAVLFTYNLYAPTLLMGMWYSTSLYLNPWANLPYEGVLTKLTTFRLEAGALQEHPGSSLHELLRLRRRELW